MPQRLFLILASDQGSRLGHAADARLCPRRGAGAVDRGGLENRCTLMGTEGSNPSLSASVTIRR
jgi:hypothetical protein